MSDLSWWQKAVFYQIYPRTFADGNGDGIGDLSGIIAKLDYLKDLGIDAIWLSPHYPSPQVDCGYDIASYVEVAPEYGSLDDFKRMIDEAHRRGIHLILDLVLNHTSDQHSWFLESRSSRDNPRRDWYIWHDGKDGGPPNDWYSTFGGSAWEFDPQTGQYYYHFFFKEQPDLNWNNPEVKQAMWEAVRGWLDLGVDGFRLDAIGTIFEEPGLPNQESGYTLEELQKVTRLAQTAETREESHRLWEKMFRYQHDLPGMHALMQELRRVIDEYPNRVLVGETDEISYYGSGRDEMDLIFNFPLMRTNRLTPDWVRANQSLRLGLLPAGAWPCNTLGNHDSPRVYSHFGDGIHNEQQARLHLALILTLKGTPFLYNGEEIGMSDYLITDLNQYRDRLGLLAYQLERDVIHSAPEEAILQAALRGRDKCRTPFQWSDEPNGGFCPAGVEPWLPVNPNYTQGVNYATQANDPESLFSFYKHLLQVRKRNAALVSGDYQPVDTDDPEILAFLRSAPGEKCLVALNFTAQARPLRLSQPLGRARLVFSTCASRGPEEAVDQVMLQPFEVYIGEVG